MKPRYPHIPRSLVWYGNQGLKSLTYAEDSPFPLLIVGSGDEVAKDVERAMRLFDLAYAAPLIAAVNRGTLFAPPPLSFVITYHPECIPEFLSVRKMAGIDDDAGIAGDPLECPGIEVHAHKARPDVDVSWDMSPGRHGTSGLFAVQVGLALGFRKIVLAGVPITGLYAGSQEHWLKCERVLMGRVRSMSGWTREFLGAPDEQFIIGG